MCWMKKRSTSPPCGNLVDGLPRDCHTKTIAKPARVGPAENGKLMENFFELSRFCSMKYRKTQRKPCQAYVENRYGDDKMYQTVCQRQIDEVADFSKIEKNEEFQDFLWNFVVYFRFSFFFENYIFYEEALYESSVRKPG